MARVGDERLWYKSDNQTPTWTQFYASTSITDDFNETKFHWTEHFGQNGIYNDDVSCYYVFY